MYAPYTNTDPKQSKEEEKTKFYGHQYKWVHQYDIFVFQLTSDMFVLILDLKKTIIVNWYMIFLLVLWVMAACEK